ncbi:hypothetical protein KVG88_21470 [Pseudomonas sp. SWRI74]|uniref:Uncharacterized protein n=1 Tax=Pseudomonas azerbaijanoccidentalis TaxID=2842347 RepID=A0ABS6QW11_9PSED|nr:hypothetical protein [Pseudomonas azerbaijanoccidentalis]MBV4522636.1 hypothetical protein [Pseudomonas azerbaijanoccidentalis]
MSRIALPFLTLPNELVDFSGWMIGPPGEPLFPASDILENWDYEQDVQVNIHVHIDFTEAADRLGIDAADLKLAVVLVAGTGSGSLPRRVDRLKTAVIDIDEPAVTLEATIPGRTLSGQLQLSLRIVLAAPVDSGSLLSPKQQGARLWQHHKNILIEDGGDSRFPIELASFSESFKARPEQYAPWLVDWNPTALDADFSGNVRLYVNSDIERICSRFVEGDALTLQAMVADVMTQIIEAAIDVEDAAELYRYEEGSIGYQARAWMEMSFPGQSMENIRQLRSYAPGKFKALILATADFGDNK